MKTISFGFAVFLASINLSKAVDFDVQPNVTVVETTRRSMGMGVMLPEGSPWCENGAPMYWFMGHAVPENYQCEISPGVFERVKATELSVVDRHGCTVFDVDNDGILDIICSVGGKVGTAVDKSNEVYLTQNNGTLLKVANHGLESPTRRSKDFIALKAGNGDDLLFEAVHASIRDDGKLNNNKMFRRIKNRNPDGGKYFKEIDGPWDDDMFYPLSVIPGKFNKDSATDLFMVGRQLPKQFYKIKVYTQQKKFPGKFRDTKIQDKWNFNYRWSAATAADVNGDGLYDMIGFDEVKKRFFIFYNKSFRGSLKFQRGILPHRLPANETMGIHVRDIRVFDVNGDGLMDIYVSQSRNDENKYCYTRPKGGFLGIVREYGIVKKDMFDFVPPIDPVPDLLFIQKPKVDGKPRYPRFKRHDIHFNARGCAGRIVPYGDQKLAVAYNYGQWPGYQYLLDWSDN